MQGGANLGVARPHHVRREQLPAVHAPQFHSAVLLHINFARIFSACWYEPGMQIAAGLRRAGRR